MARPKKHNADYFSHDADMRNDPRVKAIRRKFSHAGYAVWNMLLEVITDSDFFTVEWSEIDIEILAGDFDVTPDQLTEIVDYCVKLGLLQIEHNPDNILTCAKLKERFAELLNKRERNAKKGVSVAETTPQTEFLPQKPQDNGVSDVQNPQSKVKYSKVKYSKVNLSTKEKESIGGVGEIDGGGTALPSPLDENPQELKTPPAEVPKNPPVAAPPLNESPIEDEKMVNFKKFQNWILTNAPRVAQLKEPFTQVEFERLKHDFTTVEIEELLKKMHNYQPLLAKNISANLTFRNWANIDKKRNNETKSTTAAGRTTARNEAEAIKRTERAELEGLAAAILSGAAGGQS